MLFPDQLPVVLIALVVALLAMALMAAARVLLRQRSGPGSKTCPKCGQAFDSERLARLSAPWHNERRMYHGRYTVTPMYTCPRCGETVQMPGA